MTLHHCDVAVIGAGTAGLAAERSARRAGATTRLIDPAFAGTTCATVGCMPSKLLIAAGDAAHAVRTAGTFGIVAAAPGIDGRAVMRRVRTLRDKFAQATIDGFDTIPDGTMIRATARFTGTTTLALSNGDTVEAKAVVIATGSHPSIPEPFETVRDRLLTNETLFELDDLPKSVGVIGAGPLGLELAQALARLGVDVALFDKGTALAGFKDRRCSDVLREIMADEFALHLDVETEVEAVDGGVRVSWTGADSGARVFERLLIATGRPPSLDGLDIGRAGITLDDAGVPEFDRDTLQCGDAPLFVAGDADGERPVLHEASSEGAIAGRNAAGYPQVVPGRRCVWFAISFTDPPCVSIGDVTPDGHCIGEASYAQQGRATAMATNRGIVRLFADPADGRLVGATMVAPAAEHLGHLIAWEIERGATATEILDRPFYHPTYEEGLKPALREICAIVGGTPPADRDEGDPAGD